LVRNLLRDPLVWAMTVMVQCVFVENRMWVSLTQDEKVVQAFRADGANESLGVSVGVGRLHRGLQDSGTLGGEHRVERGDELGIADSDVVE
jgi:hypothetical protein